MSKDGNKDFRRALQEITARAEKKGIAKGAIGGAIAGAAAVLVSSAIINGIAGIGEGAEDPYKKQPVSSTSIGMQSKSVKDIKGLYEFLGPIYPGKEKVQEATGKIVNVSLNYLEKEQNMKDVLLLMLEQMEFLLNMVIMKYVQKEN